MESTTQELQERLGIYQRVVSSLVKYITKAIDLFYIKPLRRVFSQQVFRYLACGGITAMLDAVWYYIIYHYIVCEQFIDLGFIVMSPHIAALCIVFPITFFTGFWLNRNVAFRVSDISSLPQLAKYALTVLGSILLNYACMKFFVEWCGVWATPSKILTTAVCAVYSFLVGRYFTFKR
ncbi:MAG: GtrA family protein [Alistipes sp.]|nr:GtrA family protein [Alistipes sp.]